MLGTRRVGRVRR